MLEDTIGRITVKKADYYIKLRIINDALRKAYEIGQNFHVDDAIFVIEIETDNQFSDLDVLENLEYESKLVDFGCFKKLSDGWFCRTQ